MATINEVGARSGLSPDGSYSGSYTWTLGNATINEIRVSGKCENNKSLLRRKNSEEKQNGKTT